MTKEVEKQNEEQRKLQVTGGSTFILSLPKDWAIRNDLKRGSSMVVREEDDGSLSIAPSKFVKKEKQDEAYIKASLNDNPDAVMRTAISAYLDGFNILHIRAQGQKVLSSKLRNHLKTFARHYLVGTEIVIDTPTDLTLQVLLNYPELTVQNALSRMSIIASSMHKEAIAALKKLDYSAAKSVIETDREVNRFGLYIVRLLKLAVSNTLLLKEIVNEELLEKISQLSGLANSMFETSMDALFRHDFNLAESVIEKISQVHKLEKETVLYSQNVKIEEIANLRLLIESVRRTAEYASDISEVVLNLNVESVLS